MHALIVLWFSWVKTSGYVGVLILMLLESTILPVPAEIVLPPAAYWAAQGQLSFTGVLTCGILGNLLGALLMYGFFYWTRERFLHQLLRWRLIKESQLISIESWVRDFGAPGVFFARLLPGFRQLVSIPAGMFRMKPRNFALASFLGSTVWCSVLVFWGKKILGSHPELLNSPEDMMNVVRKEMFGFVLLIVGVALLYAFAAWYRVRHNRTRQQCA